MERDHYFVIAAWREGDVAITSVQEERFVVARRAWIGQGYRNLQSEWFARAAAIPLKFHDAHHPSPPTASHRL